MAKRNYKQTGFRKKMIIEIMTKAGYHLDQEKGKNLIFRKYIDRVKEMIVLPNKFSIEEVTNIITDSKILNLFGIFTGVELSNICNIYGVNIDLKHQQLYDINSLDFSNVAPHVSKKIMAKLTGQPIIIEDNEFFKMLGLCKNVPEHVIGNVITVVSNEGEKTPSNIDLCFLNEIDRLKHQLTNTVKILSEPDLKEYNERLVQLNKIYSKIKPFIDDYR